MEKFKIFKNRVNINIEDIDEYCNFIFKGVDNINPQNVYDLAHKIFYSDSYLAATSELSIMRIGYEIPRPDLGKGCVWGEDFSLEEFKEKYQLTPFNLKEFVEEADCNAPEPD